mmetsp:Transcript_6073/g.15510  ORF Transcript_6073/g.15510 Transcript_6073/m.15510 type:complete len:219 (-) Transcript_6073:106-762(-)
MRALESMECCVHFVNLGGQHRHLGSKVGCLPLLAGKPSLQRLGALLLGRGCGWVCARLPARAPRPFPRAVRLGAAAAAARLGLAGQDGLDVLRPMAVHVDSGPEKLAHPGGPGSRHGEESLDGGAVVRQCLLVLFGIVSGNGPLRALNGGVVPLVEGFADVERHNVRRWICARAGEAPLGLGTPEVKLKCRRGEVAPSLRWRWLGSVAWGGREEEGCE